MDTPKSPRRERTVLLVTAAVVGIPLLELWLGAPVLLVETLPERPVLGTVLFLLAGLGLALCYMGARLESPRAVRFLGRLLPLLFTIAVAALSIDLLPSTVMGVGMHSASSVPFNLRLIAIAALVCMAAAGLKFSLGLRIRYWILLIAAFGFVLVATAALQWYLFGEHLHLS